MIVKEDSDSRKHLGGVVANATPPIAAGSNEVVTKPCLADQIFDGTHAESELENKLYAAGVNFSRLGWDWYDISLEIHGVPSDYRLSVEAQRVCHAAGFAKVYVNHDDKWETHYSFANDFSTPVKGWRVSYPHKRGDGEKGIWVEGIVPAWPRKWFDTGYVLVKALIGGPPSTDDKPKT